MRRWAFFQAALARCARCGRDRHGCGCRGHSAGIGYVSRDLGRSGKLTYRFRQATSRLLLPIVVGTYGSFTRGTSQHLAQREGRKSILVKHGDGQFLEWAALPLLVDWLEQPERAQTLRAEYRAYHHLVDPLPVESWIEHLEEAGFKVEEHIPILPEVTSRVFLFWTTCGTYRDQIMS